MKKTYNTYKKSGVNMAVADKLVNYISKISRKTYKKSTETKSFKNIGSFGSIFDLSPFKMNNPLIVSSTDGVGTKVEIATQFKKYNTIGIDLVAMSVNDLIVQGAKPIFFLDYIAINKLQYNKIKKILDGIVFGCRLADCALIGGETAEMPGTYGKGKFDLAGFAVGLVEKKKLLIKNKIKLDREKKILSGIVKGCEIAGCSLLGGETAEMPGTYAKNKFDLAGFAVGIVEKKLLLTKNKVKNNDLILAVPSSGLHSNGFSLVRHILKKKKI